jgi:hypothetical protein
MTAGMRHVLCGVKRRVLTKIPAENAPNALTIESCGKDKKAIP